MVNDYTSRSLPTGRFGSFFLTAILILKSLVFAQAQSCPELAGGTQSLRFNSNEDLTFYPSDLPTGKSGEERSTAGQLYLDRTKNATYPLRKATINPEFTDGTMGSVVLRFDLLGMAASSAVIRVYPGTTATGTPAEEINSGNSASYLLQTRVYSGPVTVTFQSPTPSAGGNFDIQITYTTGDQVVTSPFGFKVAYWTNFITPNSYIVLENYPDHAVPIATAYFNESKQLVSSQISFCIDYGAGAPSIGNSDFPGGYVFHPTLRPDLDKSGTTDDADALTAARMVYVLSHLPTPITDPENFLEVQSVVDAFSRRDNANYGGLHGETLAAVPSLPSPVEPEFSITGPTNPVSAGMAQNLTVNLISDGGHPRVFKLEIPAGVTVNTVTGATYDAAGKTITFATSPATATVSVTSATAAVASIRVVYDQPGFWNVKNLLVYEPCADFSGDQGFLGVSTGATPRPFREASATWSAPLTPFACTDGYFHIDNAILSYVNIATGARTGAIPVTGNPSTIGYNALDNFIWGYDRSSNQIMKIGADGSQQFTVPNMPAPASSTSGTVGTVDLNGYLYLYEPNATEYLTIDINPARGTYLQLVDPTHSFVAKTAAPWGTATTPRNISDWAYNPATGLIHAIINGSGSDAFYFVKLNPATGISTLSATPVSGDITLGGATERFDSQFFDGSGNLIVYANNGAFWYRVDSSTLISTRLSTKKGPISTGNDGASCPLINAPSLFGCSDLYYQVETDKLYSFDKAGTRTLVATLSGNLNAIGYNTIDNTLWGYDNASGQIFRLGANGAIQRFSISGMPASTQPDGFSVGTVSTNGYLYLYEKNGLEYITIDTDASRAETYLKIVDPTAGFIAKTAAPWGTTLSGGALGISDWAYNAVDNLIYALNDGSSAAPYQIVQVDPLTGTTTLLGGQVTGGGLQTNGQDFGSSIVDASGNFFVFGNTTGYLYRVNVTTKTATQLSDVATPSTSNDGAFCLLATSPPLPVTLVSFEARREGKTASLKWSTTEETNSDRFEVERSQDAKQWLTIGNLQSAGESKGRLDYHFSDIAPASGVNYYRLKMIDNDHSYAFSGIRSIDFGAQGFEISIYPNPANDILYLKDQTGTDLLKNATELSIVNAQVNQVYRSASPVSFARGVNIKGLQPGIYVLKLTLSDGSSSTHRIVVGK